MIIQKGEVILTQSGKYISDNYINTAVESFLVEVYRDVDGMQVWSRVYSQGILAVYTKETHPEEYL